MSDKDPTIAERKARYSERMKRAGFRQRQYWVHDDDHPKLKQTADKMRDKRLKDSRQA